jgi:hypothetical protein
MQCLMFEHFDWANSMFMLEHSRVISIKLERVGLKDWTLVGGIKLSLYVCVEAAWFQGVVLC